MYHVSETVSIRLFEMEEAPNNRNALASLTGDVVLEILRRLPLSLLVLLQMCLFSWNRLISDNHKVLP
jgi:hypothetical protein